jgi:hypothetical protein
MSLQTYRPSERGQASYTYESLAQAVEALSKQLDRAKAAADSLENEDDFRKFVRLSKTQEDNKTKLESFSRSLSELRRSEPSSSLDSQIATQMDGARRTFEALERQIGPIRVRQEEVEAQRKAAAEEQARQLELDQANSKEKEEALQQADELDLMGRQMDDIIEIQTVVNETTHEVDNVVTESHETVVHIDQTIGEAFVEMKEGNEELENAEVDQKGGSKIMWIILAVVIAVVVIVGTVLGL